MATDGHYDVGSTLSTTPHADFRWKAHLLSAGMCLQKSLTARRRCLRGWPNPRKGRTMILRGKSCMPTEYATVIGNRGPESLATNMPRPPPPVHCGRRLVTFGPVRSNRESAAMSFPAANRPRSLNQARDYQEPSCPGCLATFQAPHALWGPVDRDGCVCVRYCAGSIPGQYRDGAEGFFPVCFDSPSFAD